MRASEKPKSHSDTDSNDLEENKSPRSPKQSSNREECSINGINDTARYIAELLEKPRKNSLTPISNAGGTRKEKNTKVNTRGSPQSKIHPS
jgi:hypothetical protein